MTLKMLKQYRALLGEIRYFEKKIKSIHNPSTHDTVQASSGPGNSLREVSVYGDSSGKSKYERLYRRAHKRAERMRDMIEEFIYGIEDSEIRQILTWRFLERTDDDKPITWQAIATRMGYQDESTPRQKIKEYFSNPGFPRK